MLICIHFDISSIFSTQYHEGWYDFFYLEKCCNIQYQYKTIYKIETNDSEMDKSYHVRKKSLYCMLID